ncbi:phage major capsid protein [Nesterenkonia pannonica]|uniref:phage major capsid protein n=1 Tax=Nesterenkonia pannonica TaxID=1548602 RepID=UPI002164A922|nr:phage major capsid protein [Nesterenkonia pannonica]
MADISRSDALALLATQDINEIVQEATESSAALNTFRSLRMSAGQARMPVLSALPTAGFVGESATDSDGMKPLTNVSWGRKELIAEEIACIVPVHENVLDDANFDIWGEVRPWWHRSSVACSTVPCSGAPTSPPPGRIRR